MLKKLNRSRYRQVSRFNWRLNFFQKVERKERLLKEKSEEAKETVEVLEPIKHSVTLRSSTRERKTPRRYEDSSSSFALIIEDGKPSCYQEAIDDADSEIWKKAMEEEMNSLDNVSQDAEN